VAEREEGLGGGVGIEHAFVLAEHEDGMRQRSEQQIVLDVPALADARALACRLRGHAASSSACA
jgi:hypothetical protein